MTPDQLQEMIERPMLVRTLDMMFSQAINSRATSIQIESLNDGSPVRYQVDGVFDEVMMLPRHNHLPVTARIKYLGKMDICECNMPQEGVIDFVHDQETYRLRVSVTPSVYGENVAIEIVSQQNS